MEPINASITANVLFNIPISIDNDFLSVKRISKAKYHPIKRLNSAPYWGYSLIRYVKNKLKQVTILRLRSTQRGCFSWHCITDSLVLSYAKKVGLISQKCT